MAVNIGTLRGYLELNTQKWVTPLQQSVAVMDQMADRATKLGTTASVALTAPLVTLGTVVTKSFVSFESAMKEVQAALDLTGTQGAADFKRLEDAAIEWGAKTKFSATESAEALGELGKAGFDVNQSIAGLPSVLQLATVAKMGLADAATLTADTLTQFNLKVDQAGRVNDVLAKGAQSSTVDVQQLGESLKYAGPVASAFGMSIEDTVGALAAFGNSGIKASQAGTALRSILSDIEVPTKGMKDTLAKLGIETLKSADGTTKLADVIDTLRARGATAGDVMTAFGQQAGPVMVSLVSKGSDGIRKLTDQMYQADGAASKVSDTMMSGLGGALEEMSGAVETAGMAMGRVLAPAVAMGAQAIGALAGFLTTTVVPAFEQLPIPIQVGIGAILALAAAVGPTMLVIGQIGRAAALGAEGFDLVVRSGGTLLRTLRDVGAAGADFVTGLLGWGRAANDTVISISKVGSAASATASTIATVEHAALAAAGAQTALGAGATTASGGLLTMGASAGIASAANITLTTTTTNATRAMVLMQVASTGALTRFAGAGASMATSFAQIGRGAQLALPAVTTITTTATSAATSTSVWATATGVLARALAFIGGPITVIIGAVTGLIALIRYLTGSWQATWDVIKIGVPILRVVEGLWKGLQAVLAAAGPVWAATASFMSDVWVVVKALAGDALADLVTWCTALGKDALKWVADALKSVAGWLSPVWEWMKKAGTVAADFAKAAGGLLADGLGLLIQGLRVISPAFADFERAITKAISGSGTFWAWLVKAREGLHELAEFLRKGFPEVKPPALFTADAGGAIESLDALSRRMNELLPGEQKLRLAVGATGKAYGTLSEQLRETTAVVNALTATQQRNIKDGIALGRSSEDIAAAINQMGGGVRVTTEAIDLYKDRLSDATKHTKDLTKATQEQEKFQKLMADSVWDTTQKLREIEKKRLDDAKQGMERSAAAIQATLSVKTQAEQRAAELSRQLTMNELEFKLDAIHREGEARKKALDLKNGLDQQASTAVTNEVALSMEKAVRESEEFKAVMLTLGAIGFASFDTLIVSTKEYRQAIEEVAKKTDAAAAKTMAWRAGLKTMASGFAELAQATNGALSSAAKSIGGLLNTMEVGAQAGETFMKGLKESMGPGNKNWGSISANIATGLLGGFGAMAQATDPMKGTLERVIGGASTAAAIGGAAAMAASWATTVSATGQIYIVAAAAIVGAFVGYFRGQAARREMKIVGQEWGQDISEGLSEEIRNATSFSGDRVANAIFRMNDIISEAGGIDASNFDRLIPKLRDVFVMVETGMFSVADAQRVLNENFRDFAQASINSGQLASRTLQEIIRLNAEMGIGASEIIAFVSEQTTRVGSGLATIAGPITAGIITWRTEVETTQKTLDELAANGKVGTEEWIAAQTRLNELGREHGQLVAENAADLEALGVIALATFGAAIESGVGYVEAIRAVGPGIDAIIDAQKTLGITSGNVAVQDLVNFRERVRNNETLVASAEALDDTLVAISHTTGLNADSLAAMEQLGLSTFEKLRAAGFSEVEALKMMGSFLENVTQAHMDLGIPIDDNIGALINLAAEHGIVNEKAKDFGEIFGEGVTNMVDAINALITTLGGVPTKVADLGAASKTTKDKVASDADDMAKAQDGVKTAVGGVHDRLLDTRPWQTWRDAGVRAAEDVSYAVDAVSLGHSPGGIKEIPIKLRDAIAAAQEFKRRSVADFEAVERAVNALSEEQVDAIRLLLEVGRPIDEIASALDISTAALDRFVARERDVAAAAEDAARAIEQQREEAERMSQSLGDMNHRLLDEIGLSRVSGRDRELLELSNRQRDEIAGAEAMRPTLGAAVDETIRLITQKFDLLRNEALRKSAEEQARLRETQSQQAADALARYTDLAQRLQDQTALIGKTGLERELLQLSFSRRDELADLDRNRAQFSAEQLQQLVAAVVDKYARLEAQARFDALDKNSFAEGTGGFRDFGTGTPAMLHGWEAVVPEDEYKAMVRGLQSPDMDAVSGRGGTTVVTKVTIDARGALLGDFESQQRLKRLFDDAFMNEYEMRRQVGTAGVR